ncbi:13861_t:CDS:2, partial [Entrophospora sp. SA101]
NIDKDNGDLSVSDKKEQKQKANELPKKYQSYPHWRSSCYITSFLELLYTNYLHTTMWWTTNVGVIPSNSGLKKLYTSFTIRDTVNTPGTKNVKSTFNEAREIVHHHVLEKKCQEDNQFGSLTHWFENIILKEKESTKLMSQFCVLGLRIWSYQPCPYNRANLYQCINQEISYEEYIIFWPHTLIFEITQRD